MTDAAPCSPRVSVVTTTYRTPSDLLARSLDSILEQTFDDLEVLLVIDGELDDAGRAVVEQRVDERLKVERPGRVGRARALNAGLAGARGDLVAIHDADDESHRERIARQVQVFERRPDIDLLGTDARRVPVDASDARWPLPPVDRASVEVLGERLLLGNPFVHSSVMARRSVLESLGGYSVDRRYQFDHDLYLRARRAGCTLARLDEPLVLKRQHADQAFESGSPFLPRLLSAWKLQVDHARGEPAPRRYAYELAASFRLAARVAKTSVRRLRSGTKAGSEP